MSVTVASFRQSFPEFFDPSLYDANSITAFINLGVAFQNPARWDPLTIDYGTGLFVGHNLVLQARASAAAKAGGIPGTVEGVRTQKSVDKVAVGYDVNSVIEKDASWWNMTTYGIRFIQLTRAYGAGGFQLGLQDTGIGTPQLFLGPLV